MAVDARRDHVRLFLPQFAADDLAMHGLDLRVALRAGLGDILLGDRGTRVRVGKLVVRRVATGADRGNGQALLEEANAMNTIFVIFEDIGLRNSPRPADFGILAVTLAAQSRNIDSGDRRLQIGRGQDVMRSMTELATGGVRVVLCRLLPVDAGGILALLVAMATGTIDSGQLLRMGHCLDVAVACDAVQGGVGGRLQGGCVEARGHSRLARPDARTGIVTAGAVLGTWWCRWRRLLAAQAGSQQGRDGSEPKELHGRHGVAFLNRFAALWSAKTR